MKLIDFIVPRIRPVALYSANGKELYPSENVIAYSNKEIKTNPSHFEVVFNHAKYQYSFPFLSYLIAKEYLKPLHSWVDYTLYLQNYHSFSPANTQKGMLLQTPQNQLFIYNTNEDILLQVLTNKIESKGKLSIVEIDTSKFLHHLKP